MILTDSAFLSLDQARDALLTRLHNLLHGDDLAGEVAEPDLAGSGTTLDVIDLSSFRLTMESSALLSADERRARAMALRGMTQARQGDFASAHGSFCSAVSFDPRLELSKLPEFMKLPREAHEAAIAAYEDAQLPAMAAAITAQVRSTFQLRLLDDAPNAEPRAAAQ